MMLVKSLSKTKSDLIGNISIISVNQYYVMLIVLGSNKLSVIVGKLIDNFSNLVSWEPVHDAVPDHRGKYREEDKVYTKLIQAPVCVLKILE